MLRQGFGAFILLWEARHLTMPYCPECLAEYVEGAVNCIDCGVALRPGLPPARPSGDSPEVKLVRVRTFRGPTAQLDADLARNLLQEEGIPCVLPGQSSAEVLPGVGVVQLLVRKEDAEEAVEILKSYLDSPGAAEER